MEMALVDVIISCTDSIKQISEHIEGAIVYLDAGTTESFQFIGAYALLLDLGARTVCSLESLCALDTSEPSAGQKPFSCRRQPGSDTIVMDQRKVGNHTVKASY